MNKGHDKGHKGQMSDREAMKLALEALENWMRIDTVEDMHIFETVTAPEAIAVLRQALEQEPWDTSDMAYRPGGLSMEQEPVYAFRRKGLDDFCTCDKRRYDELASKPDLFEVAVFYTAPPKCEWIWLTDEEILVCGGMDGADNWVFQFANALQIKLREKNHG